jgi:hypothetical protein
VIILTSGKERSWQYPAFFSFPTKDLGLIPWARFTSNNASPLFYALFSLKMEMFSITDL